MHSIFLAIGNAGGNLAAHAAHAATACKSTAIIAGHKISAGFAAHALPAIKLAWAQTAQAAAATGHFLATPIGICVVGLAAGAISTTVGISMIIASRGDKLAGEQNKVARRIVLTAGIAFTLIGISLAAGSVIGGAIILL